jgi:hypothetical protein
MQGRRFYSFFIPVIVLAAALIFPCGSQAQSTGSTTDAPQRLISAPIDESRLTTLRGNVHPLARPESDLGAASSSQPMQRMLLVLKRSPEQEAALRQLLDDQQSPASASYKKWLTPSQFGQQFGPTDADLQTITAWLQSHGFQVASTHGRTSLEFSGSAGQVQEAFHTTIHKYLVNGEQRWANSSDPQIPTALTPAVAGIASLNNFPRQPMNSYFGKLQRNASTGKITRLFTYQPSFTCSADNFCFSLGPYDFATIYNVLPLWNASINGAGQTIAIVGESNINPQDVANFRSLFGLPANSTANGNPLNIILNGPDPGLQADESEADIDVQWSGAVAPYATIDFVVSQSTETTSGVDLSAAYIIDNNLAPVMSESYGYCELGLGTAGNQFYNSLWQQAAAQGISVFISAGDNGSAGCDNFNAQSPAPAQFGLQVSGYASTPYNVAVGGTDFYEFTNPEIYWSTTNNSITQASALGYIPETTWNDSCTNAIFGQIGYSTNPEANCNNSRLIPYYVLPEGGSGGVSNCTTPSGSTAASCAGGYVKPTWQTGTGVPNDGKRDLPDVSLFASNGFAGSSYVVCETDLDGGTCDSNSPYQNFLGFGGTSVSSPAFAGIMALVNQHTGSRQGNPNYTLYKLAAKDTRSSCNASSNPSTSCIFNDVTSGTIAMPCAAGSSNCTTSVAGDPYGVLTGFNAATGYDQATGLGSVNANNLVTQWTSVTYLPSTTILNSLTPTTLTHGQPVSFNVSVKPQSGSGSPSGSISLIASSASEGGIGAFTLASGTASGSTDLLPGGAYTVHAHYSGDATYGPSDSAPVSVTVSKENSQPQAFLVTFNSDGSVLNADTNTAVYGSPYVLRVNVDNASGALCKPVGSSGDTACPTGTVTLTNNGSALDAGTYALNSYGYFEDQAVQLPGGADSIVAAYAGDGSFNATSVTVPINILPGPTSMAAVYVQGASVGEPFDVSTAISTSSSGAGPTGAVTILANGSPISATTTLTPVAGTPTSTASTSVSAVATLSSPGTYTFTAAYAGDSNYSGSTAPASRSVMVQYPEPALYFQSTSYSMSPGTNITLSAEVIATGNAVPTGTVSFTNSVGAITGVTYSTVVNSSTGFTDLVATVNFTPAFSDSYLASYSGDINYPSCSDPSGLIVVNGNDFSLVLGQSSMTLTPGQTGSVPFTIGLQGTVDGQGSALPVTFSTTACGGLPSESTCYTGGTYFTYTTPTQFSITTTAPTSAGVSGASTAGLALRLGASLLLVGFFLNFAPARKRTMCSACIALLLMALLVGLPGCGGSPTTTSGGGGGGGGGGAGNPGTPAGTYPITITATSGTGSTAITHTVTLTLTVQ